jgi:sugar phosphate isomerase/epimerase
MNRLEQAALFRRKVKDHAHIKIAAGLFHMAMEEADFTQALREYSAHIGYIHLADSNCRLPGQGMLDFAVLASTLREIGYNGWLTYACGEPGSNHAHAAQFLGQLPASLAYIRQAGL